MNLLFYTLFGGMLATVLIYGALRLFRVGNFWSAVVSAGSTSFAYLVYALLQWPGLDVVSIHLAGYPTVAVMLALLYDRRRGQGLHWAPKLIVALLLIACVVFGGMAYTATHGLPLTVAQWFLPHAEGKDVHTGFAGVVPHDQEAAHSVGQHLAAEHALSTLGWEVDVQGLENMVAAQAAEVRVNVHNGANQGVDPVRVGLAFGRPGQKAGTLNTLTRLGQGRYHGQIEPMATGVWVAYLVIDADGKQNIALEHTVEVH